MTTNARAGDLYTSTADMRHLCHMQLILQRIYEKKTSHLKKCKKILLVICTD